MHKRRVFIRTALGVAAFGIASRLARGQQAGGANRRHILVLDVIETMLDTKALEPHFARAFGDGRVLQEWFANLLLYANVSTVAGPYADFATTIRPATISRRPPKTRCCARLPATCCSV
jgi:hypothetical protein